MRWFLKRSDGLFYAGGEGERAGWIEGRKGAVVFQSEGAAAAAILERDLGDAEPQEF